MEVVAHTSLSAGHGKLAQFAGGGSVKDGWFTAGERGYELGFKRGSQVQFFSHAQSRAMTGMASVPGYATGTGGSPVYITINAGLGADPDAIERGLIRALASAANKGHTIPIGKAIRN